MKASELGFIALRLSGLLLMIQAVTGGISSLGLFGWSPPSEEGNLGWVAGLYLASYLLLLGFGVYLFVYARAASEKLFGSAGGQVDELSTSALQAVAISVVGVYWLAVAVPSLAAVLVQLIWLSRAGAELERQKYIQGNGFGILEVLFQLGVGVFLFAGARGISAFWRRVRSGCHGEAA